MGVWTDELDRSSRASEIADGTAEVPLEHDRLPLLDDSYATRCVRRRDGVARPDFEAPHEVPDVVADGGEVDVGVLELFDELRLEPVSRSIPRDELARRSLDFFERGAPQYRFVRRYPRDELCSPRRVELFQGLVDDPPGRVGEEVDDEPDRGSVRRRDRLADVEAKERVVVSVEDRRQLLECDR